MARNAIWSNSDGLAVGFGTRTALTTGSNRVAENGMLESLYLVIKATELTDAVSATTDQVIHAPIIPNGATIMSATLNFTTAFTTSASGTLDIGVYDKDGGIVDDDGIDAGVAAGALLLGAEIACDGADVNTVVATTGGVKICASYDTGVFTAGEGILEVVYAPA